MVYNIGCDRLGLTMLTWVHSILPKHQDIDWPGTLYYLEMN